MHIIVKLADRMSQGQERRVGSVPRVESVRFIERSNGTIKGYAVNTFHGLVKNYNEDRVSIIMNITKPNFKGRWPRCSYFGVFDGHGGNKCSDFLKENMHKYITENAHFPHEPIEALKFGFRKAEQEFLSFAEAQNPVQRSGSCALVLLIIDEICYVANVGDSRAVLSTHGGKSVHAISKDHKPDSESQRERIHLGGGRIYQSSLRNRAGQTVLGPYRIEPGKLSVSRSFGDIEAKLPKYEGNPKVLIAKPQITYFQINSEEHDFIVMCSDGIYDKLTNEEVAECFWEQRDRHAEEKYQFIGAVPSKILERSMEKMSMDNLTALVIVFEDEGRMLLHRKGKVQDSGRRPQSSIDFENSNRNNQNNPNIQNIQNSQGRVKEERGREEVGKSNRSTKNYSRIDEVEAVLESDRSEKPKQSGRDFGKENSQAHFNRDVRELERMVKRKSTSNLTAMQERKDNPPYGSQSLNNSISAKMLLAGSKLYQKPRPLEKGNPVERPNLQELLKKRSVDCVKREGKEVGKEVGKEGREAGWKAKEKLMRF